MGTGVPGQVLTTGPSLNGRDRDCWKSQRDGRLVLPGCADCGVWRALGRPFCASFWSFATTWSEVDPAGTVFSWIRSHRAFMSELDVDVPYVTVLVELDEADRKSTRLNSSH